MEARAGALGHGAQAQDLRGNVEHKRVGWHAFMRALGARRGLGPGSISRAGRRSVQGGACSHARSALSS